MYSISPLVLSFLGVFNPIPFFFNQKAYRLKISNNKTCKKIVLKEWRVNKIKEVLILKEIFSEVELRRFISWNSPSANKFFSIVQNKIKTSKCCRQIIDVSYQTFDMQSEEKTVLFLFQKIELLFPSTFFFFSKRKGLCLDRSKNMREWERKIRETLISRGRPEIFIIFKFYRKGFSYLFLSVIFTRIVLTFSHSNPVKRNYFSS